jgi:hypothetical protein
MTKSAAASEPGGMLRGVGGLMFAITPLVGTHQGRAHVPLRPKLCRPTGSAPWPRVLHGASRKEIATLLWRIASSRAVPHQLQPYDQRVQTVPVRGHRAAVAVKQEVAELGTLGNEDHGRFADRTVAAMREDVAPIGRQRGLAMAVTLSVRRARGLARRAAK